MTTLSTMKSRIATELARSDLTTQIASAITTVIAQYQRKRFYFNESRDVTFATVATQDFYDENDAADIPNIHHIDQMLITIGTNDVRELEETSPERLEIDQGNTSTTNQPSEYARYAQKLRLYPTPSSAWTVRILNHINLAEPADDDETGNKWMTDAEKLIRCAAKYEIALNVTRNEKMQLAMSPNPPRGNPVGHATYWAFRELIGDTAGRVGTGKIIPYD